MQKVLASYLSLARTNLRMAAIHRSIGNRISHKHHIAEAKFWLESYWLAKPRS